LNKLLIYIGAALIAGAVSPRDVAAPAQKVVTAATPESSELVAFKRAIRAKYDLKEKSYATMDAETLVTRFYSADVIAIGGGKLFVGRKEIRPAAEESVKAITVKIDSVSSFVKGDAGWDWADFHVQPRNSKDPPTTLEILFLWAKVNGEWTCMGEFSQPGSFRKERLAERAVK
jgi:hypothetical protein